MNEDSVVVDITTDNGTKDFTLYWDEEAQTYTFSMDTECWYIEGMATVNNIDTANYNKELTLALLGLISAEPQAIYEKVEATLYSSVMLSATDWEVVGDCKMMDGVDSVENAYSYKIQLGTN